MRSACSQMGICGGAAKPRPIIAMSGVSTGVMARRSVGSACSSTRARFTALRAWYSAMSWSRPTEAARE